MTLLSCHEKMKRIYIASKKALPGNLGVLLESEEGPPDPFGSANQQRSWNLEMDVFYTRGVRHVSSFYRSLLSKNTSQLERYPKIHKTTSIPYVQHQMSFSNPWFSSNNLPWNLSHNMKASHGASSLPQSPHQGKTWENHRKPTNG